MTTSPLVSIIVPCYNQAQYLAEALDSVLGQQYGEWECIIVNDGATDNTEEIAKQYLEKDERFKYIFKENSGLPGARNAGIRIARGEYILPLDADDRISPYYLRDAVDQFKKQPETKLVYCKAEWFGLKHGIWPLKPYSYRELLIQNIIFCSCIYRKSDFDQISGYDEAMIRGYEDWEFLLRLLSPDDLVYRINEAHFFCRVKEVSTIYNSGNNEYDKRVYIFKKHIDKYLTYLPDPIQLAWENSMLKSVYKNSFDYKLGNRIVNPFRKLLRSIKK